MSNRTLVELNHDYCPREEDLLDWARQMRTYMGSGRPEDLPRGVTFKHMRHHSEPEPLPTPPSPYCANPNMVVKDGVTVPMVVDRADGAKGSFCIRRFRIEGTVFTAEYWNMSQWAAFCYVFKDEKLANCVRDLLVEESTHNVCLNCGKEEKI